MESIKLNTPPSHSIVVESTMRVLKRGTRGYEPIQFDKITERIKRLCVGLDKSVDPTRVALATIKNLYDGITTEELDKISAKIADSMKLVHPDYSTLAARVLVSNLHKTTPGKFSECMRVLRSKLDTVSTAHFDYIENNAATIDKIIVDDRDYSFDYFGYKTLENSYLMKISEKVVGEDGTVYVDNDGNVAVPTNFNSNGIPMKDGLPLHAKTQDRVFDRPQYMFMRVAISIHMGNLNAIKESYDAMSQMYFTHATPTLFNACSRSQQLMSCFLFGTDDSIEGIMKNLTDTALTSKRAGGIGIHMSNIRSRGSLIKGTNGKSSGLPKQLKMYNEVARTFDQGGKRLGAIAIYLEPWHGDVLKFLQMKLNQGAETERARDLFYAMWIPDLFVSRVESGAKWSLFSPDTAPGLADVYDGMDVCKKCGYCINPAYNKYVSNVLEMSAFCVHDYHPVDAFTMLYTEYENRGLAMQVVSAREIMDAICDMQRESGTPYICFKDHVNRTSNQKSVGTIKSSNLCVVPETYILTRKGQMMIKDIVDTRVEVWNGVEFTWTTPRKTGTGQKLVNVELDNGECITCTPYHKFYINNGNGNIKLDAADLKTGDTLIDYELPVIRDGVDFPCAYAHGLFCSDNDNNYDLYNCNSLQPKFTVPMTAKLSDKIDWFTGFCDGNCVVMINPDGSVIQCVSDKRDFLLHIRLMLQTIGIRSLLVNNHLHVYDIAALVSLGFKPRRFTIPAGISNVKKYPVKVLRVLNLQRTSDTYCFAELNRGMGMFNGVLAGNCAEIMEWSSADSYACCTLASINLKKFLIDGKINHELLHKIVRMITRNLDIIIDINDYPVIECKRNAGELRPIGIGVQALADVFAAKRVPFLSPEAARDDIEIFETIYHAALVESCNRAKTHGKYKGFDSSPAANGILSFDLWKSNQKKISSPVADVNIFSGRYDWDALKVEIMKYGLRNSLLVAPMPTVSTSQIMGNNESFEPFASNIYTKTTLAGKFTIANNAMVRHLIELGLWNDDVRNKIINSDGSVHGLVEIPQEIRNIYSTVWEMKQSELMKRAATRLAFIDQSQSLNIHIRDNSNAILRSVFMTGWKLGLKTGSYYIRTQPAAKAMKNNIAAIAESGDKSSNTNPTNNNNNNPADAKFIGGFKVLSRSEEQPTTECTMCSS